MYSCDGCATQILQSYRYSCTKQECDFDLHPVWGFIPDTPLCRLNPAHRLQLQFQSVVSDQCALCGNDNSPGNELAAWMYRCMACDVSTHVGCFNAGEIELSDDENEEEDDDLSALYRKFMESVEDFGNQGNEQKVGKLSELVDRFKIHTEAASSLARQHDSGPLT